MYQIIYVDIDEEITSVIDRLRKTNVSEVFFVVPKRALILQSIVSLKLLKREADKAKKGIVFVAQDEQERKTIEKSGIITKPSLDGIDAQAEMKENVTPPGPDGSMVAEEIIKNKKTEEGEKREVFGSNDFYDTSGGLSQKKAAPVQPAKARAVFKASLDGFHKKVSSPSREVQGPLVGAPVFSQPSLEAKGREFLSVNNSERLKMEKDELLRSFFEEGEGKKEAPSLLSDRKREQKREQKDPEKNVKVSSLARKVLIYFIVLCFVLTGGILMYLFLPSAKVLVTMKNQTLEKDLEIRGDIRLTELESGRLVIPARIAEKEKTYTYTFNPIGKGSSGVATKGQKARGKVVIYNEFSSASQALVANTRLLSAEKKLFRLVRGISVPGLTQVGGKNQPGAIEAEVIADEPGEEFNIGASSFTIPGFEGGPKFEKFYAKSTSPMSGGSSSGAGVSVAMSGSVSQSDLDNAKSKAENEAKVKIEEEMKNEISSGEVLVDGVLEKNIIEGSSGAKIGEIVSQFEYSVKIKARALVFSGSDVKKVFEQQLKLESSADPKNVPKINLEYGVGSADFSSGTINIKVHGKVMSEASLDITSLARDLVGKREGDVLVVLKKYPQVKEVEIDFSPDFFPEKFPQSSKRIKIEIR